MWRITLQVKGASASTGIPILPTYCLFLLFASADVNTALF